MNANHPGAVRRVIPSALLLLGALAIAGCNDAQITNVWQDPSFQGQVHTVLVVSQAPNPATRRIWEDAICTKMTKDGVEAVVSYEIFPESPPSKAQMTRTLQARHLDAALILKPMASAIETRWVPGYTTTEPRFYYDPWRDRQLLAYRDRYHRGYRVRERIERQQVTLWSAENGGQMVWAGTVLIPSSTDNHVSDELASGVVPEMKKAGLI